MKVILLQDVAKIGKRSSIVNVPDGYALNQLIPKCMAEPATPANLKKIEKLQATAEADKIADEERYNLAVKALSDKKVSIATDVNDKGHLFKAISENDIAKAAEEMGILISSAMVVVGDPIKEIGDHDVYLVRGSAKNRFTIEVVKK